MRKLTLREFLGLKVHPWLARYRAWFPSYKSYTYGVLALAIFVYASVGLILIKEKVIAPGFEAYVTLPLICLGIFVAISQFISFDIWGANVFVLGVTLLFNPGFSYARNIFGMVTGFILAYYFYFYLSEYFSKKYAARKEVQLS